MKAHGAYTALVSGGFDVFTSRIAAKLGFDENRANRLIEADGKLTGNGGRADPRPRRQGGCAERDFDPPHASPRPTRWPSATAPTIST
jgi:hypothetical protein